MGKRIMFLLFFLFSGAIIIHAQTPTKWRGSNANGMYSETGLLKQWPSAGPDIIWSYTGLGEGYSSPVFANDLIYLSAGLDSVGHIVALTPDGKLKWKAPYGKEFYESYPGARSSPTVAGNLLYIYSGYGVVTCMDATNGAIKWKKDTFREFGGKNLMWGVTETLVVDGDLVFVTPGGSKQNVVALNRFMGAVVWTSAAKGELSAYCTPLIVNLPQRKLLVTHSAHHIIGLDAANGNMLWSYPHTNRYQIHPNTPVFHEGGLFCFSGYGQGGVKLNLSADGSKVEKAWSNSSLDSRMGGMVLVNGYLYGSGDNNREWRCVDWKTGTEKYASKEIAKGVVIYADGMLYCYSERGELALVEASPSAFEVVSKTTVKLGTAQHWAHPVINSGKLYVRHGDTLIAYKIK